METELLRTFLEVNRTRHFARAADNLFLTQAAVSARIRQLEGVIGEQLFTRRRNNIQLTVAGHQLVGHAEAMVRQWNLALRNIGAQSEGTTPVAIGCLPSLWEIYLTDCLPDLCRQVPEALPQIELLSSDVLIARVRDQSLSVGLVYEPPQSSDLTFEHLTTVELTLVSTTPDLTVDQALPNYVYVDWGPSFSIAHDAWDLAAETCLKIDAPRYARQFLLNCGGTCYLPRSMISADLQQATLFSVKGSVPFDRSAYLIRNAHGQPLDATLRFVSCLADLLAPSTTPSIGTEQGG